MEQRRPQFRHSGELMKSKVCPAHTRLHLMLPWACRTPRSLQTRCFQRISHIITLQALQGSSHSTVRACVEGEAQFPPEECTFASFDAAFSKMTAAEAEAAGVTNRSRRTACYEHRYFVRGRPDTLCMVVRKTNKTANGIVDGE